MLYSIPNIIIKDGIPTSYNISFFGGLKQLDELFLDDTLDRLDYKRNNLDIETKVFTSLSQFDWEWNSGNFINSINLSTFKDGHIITPLIGYSTKDWNYGGGSGGAVKDISTSGGAITEDELRCSIRVKKILEAIEVKYDIKFSNNFFGTANFRNLFMWLNENKDYNLAQPYPVNMTSLTIPSGGVSSGEVTLESGFIKIKMKAKSISWNIWTSSNISFQVVPTNPLYLYEAYIVDEYNEKLQSWGPAAGNRTFSIAARSNGQGGGASTITRKYKLILVPYQSNSFTTTANIKHYVTDRSTVGFPPTYTHTYIDVLKSVASISPTIFIRIEDMIPKMKVKEFIQALMKQFKLIAKPSSTNTFYFDTLDNYYRKFNSYDITEWVDIKEVTYEKPEIYDNLIFKYEKTNNFLGATFRKNNDPADTLGYGDLKAKVEYVKNKKELKVEIPFENMLFDRITTFGGVDTEYVVGLAASSNDSGVTFSKNKGKPILFYLNGISRNLDNLINIKFLGNNSLASYTYCIGNTNDMIYDQVSNTLNWGTEIDPWHRLPCDTSLFKNYWKNWIDTIYSIKQKKVKVKAIIPSTIIDELSLNDRIIIGDSRFKINDYTIDLTNNMVDLNLFIDIYDFNSDINWNGSTIAVSGRQDKTLECNAIGRYYGMKVYSKTGTWSAQLVDAAFGTTWAQLGNTSGEDGDELLIYVNDKTAQTPPAVYQSRDMKIRITNGTSTYDISLYQTGL